MDQIQMTFSRNALSHPFFPPILYTQVNDENANGSDHR